MTIDSETATSRSETGLGRADRLQPLLLTAATGVGLLIGRTFPDVAGLAARTVSIAVFALITLVMMGVDPRHVARVFDHRRFLAAAIGLNFVVNPIVAWALANTLLRGQPDLQVGLVLFLVTPCIGWYLIFTELAGGDTELGVGLLGINVILQMLALPLYLQLFVGSTSGFGIATIVRSVTVYLILPATLAALVRVRWARRGRAPGEQLTRFAIPTLKTVSLGLVLVSMFASQADAIFGEIGAVARLIAPMVLFFGATFALATTTARVIGLRHDQTALLVFTTTSRNSEASLAIAATAFASPLVGLTVALGPVIELPLLIVMTRVLQRRARSSP